MDKNTFWGFFLIALIIIGFSFFNRPTKEQLAAQQHYRDSVAYMRQMEMEAQEAVRLAQEMTDTSADTDTAQAAQKIKNVYGAFAPSATGENTYHVVENEVLRLTFASKGGYLHKAELKNYKTYKDTVNYLCLFEGEESSLGFTLVTANNRIVNTRDLYFRAQPVLTLEDGSQQLTMRLLADSAAHLDIVYTIHPDNYMLNASILAYGMQDVLAQNITGMELQWHQLIRQQEQGRKFEERYATLQYMFKGDDIENLSESKNDSKSVNNRLQWIAYKDQFFSSVLIADDAFTSAQMESKPLPKSSAYIKQYDSKATVGFDPSGQNSTNFRLYLGPNHYNTLKAYDKGVAKAERLHLNELVPLGWKIVAWINKILVIPMFDLFTSWGLHIGIIILLMTLVIKLIILPFTFTSYRSTAKMRVLKPQLDEINAKYPPEKMQERQQATMALYNKAGVSPMSGCLPMLFQFPVLMAMFWFFPTAIELRGQSFLWAHDLSTYDAILSWNTYIPLISSTFGNHISLFCLLMTITNIIYTWLNMQTQAGGQEMKMMKWMMYLMPVFFMFIFNEYAAGLSYYYLLSLLITIIQTYIFRWSINDEKLLKKMQEKQAKNAKNPKKSGLMARLEKMQREQQAYAREQAKKRTR
ncbi:MAG: membrane protein insertase YidC [Paludibacter sp.]|nr:membrane protein insertase YidC [Bacteroidales bacterium]MCM1069691.1 membrane protein insertase YidC [Prevotella sp.]MCM1354401.1 membrane protein insertase YidC [Bacteroides sp.]MCM1441948.1 membrane protein insertase YidC [Muribaculum sp.]MCM1482622.1 membrane protein insertase YidC [Paludibacter sp.]